MATRDEIEAEAEDELEKLRDAEPIPLEQQMREDNEARREAFKQWQREITGEE
ncbi:hypothetical protein [Natronosalvus rutilus]|uniref:Uncharacterized protein n=1 Tax=Natronosalvus rutilus TaxID=2953753 RepID=A0A9E7NFA9_9EURY|nr:hypothetical protein [Natronosalvus rutilus]UTF55955.1 hypothetical protein NGM29_20910 [Natronosalvus rutilus]